MRDDSFCRREVWGRKDIGTGKSKTIHTFSVYSAYLELSVVEKIGNARGKERETHTRAVR